MTLSGRFGARLRPCTELYPWICSIIGSRNASVFPLPGNKSRTMCKHMSTSTSTTPQVQAGVQVFKPYNQVQDK